MMNCYNISNAPYVRIRSDPTVNFNNNLQSIVDKRSKFFHMMLIPRQTSTSQMKMIYVREFKFLWHMWLVKPVKELITTNSVIFTLIDTFFISWGIRKF